ncbi:MAG: type II secretion system F family protein [Deltaproteobacteria bacterium]|nr:type II secretion system F family protein [Deltaproteobacteria bacterium]
MIIQTLIIAILTALLVIYLWRQQRAQLEISERLTALGSCEEETDVVSVPINWQQTEQVIARLRGRYGKAGFMTAESQRQAELITMLIYASSIIGGAILGYQRSALIGAMIGSFIGLYLGALIWVSFLKSATNNFQRKILFQIPLFLEDIILLVEAGLGVFPAIEKVVSTTEAKSNPVKMIFAMVYQLSAHGMPFNKALELIADAVNIKVLRHVLMHLDIANSEGGELIPSLRSLSEHAHSEWKLSVETRVKRLENMVVFPVFFSVIGLMLLVAAVPAIPLLNLNDSLKVSRQTISTPTSNINTLHYNGSK